MGSDNVALGAKLKDYYTRSIISLFNVFPHRYLFKMKMLVFRVFLVVLLCTGCLGDSDRPPPGADAEDVTPDDGGGLVQADVLDGADSQGSEDGGEVVDTGGDGTTAVEVVEVGEVVATDGDSISGDGGDIVDDDGDDDGVGASEGDCDDDDKDVFPGAADPYGDGKDTDCDGVDGVDGDGDGFAGGEGPDCNDENAKANPESGDGVGDGIDLNCDGVDGIDKDGDGYASNSSGGDDCDDTTDGVHPQAQDSVGNSIDENCDGMDGKDEDEDGYASTGSGGNDCDDKDSLTHPGIADMLGDGKDTNCDGMDGMDGDGDGYASEPSGGSDCDDDNKNTYPGANEVLGDGVDSNCDGHDSVDADGDGYASEFKGGDDCNENDKGINPGAADEVGDGVDKNCDGHDGVDEDGDGYASEDSGGADCDDNANNINPAASDPGGNGVDNDCDGVDGIDGDGDGFANKETGGKDPNDGDSSVYPPTNFEVAKHWAPVFYHDTDDDHYEADYITAVDFDGDWVSDNNWENLESTGINLGAVIYFSVIETKTHWFVLYADFHPRDWAKDCSPFICLGVFCEPCHENDMEGAMVVVRKDMTTYGYFELLYTEAHNTLHAFTNDPLITKASHHGIENGVPVTFEDGTHPELYVESKGHGVCALYFDGQEHGVDHCKHDVDDKPPEFGGDDGVVYRYKGTKGVPSSGNDHDVGYSLRSLEHTLWSRREDYCADGCLFDKAMVYGGMTIGGAFDGDNYGEDRAMPPWAWDDPHDGGDVQKGDFFFKPAHTFDTHFQVPGGVSQEYLYNPYLP